MIRIPVVAIPLYLECELVMGGVEAVLAIDELPRQEVWGGDAGVPGAVVDDGDGREPVAVSGAAVLENERADLLAVGGRGRRIDLVLG